MYFMLKYIKQNTDIKIILSGDGLDELCGGKYNINLTDNQYREKTIELLRNLNKNELSRCDKISGNFGLELRYPFLDKFFLEFILTIHPMLKKPQISVYSKKPIEKYIIRKSFDFFDFINKKTLWRPSQTIDKCFNELNTQLLDYFNNYYSDMELFNYTQETSVLSKEQMYFKIIYDKLY